MDFKQAKVATSLAYPSVATPEGSSLQRTAKASGENGLAPTQQSIADTFSFVATKGNPPPFDPASDPLRALRAAINSTKGISPDIEIPTVEHIVKDVDPTGNSLMDGSLLQQYEDLKLIYTTEQLALEDKVAQGTATPQDVADLKKFTALLTTIDQQIAEIEIRQDDQRALYQAEIDALKAFGIKHADEKYHTISKDDIAQYDLNNDGNIGALLEGSALYTGVAIGVQTIEDKENYTFLDKVTLKPVQFDPVTGDVLGTGISNPNYNWDLRTSGLVDGQITEEGTPTGFTADVDVTFNIDGHFLGERKAYEGSANRYNVQVDLPIPQSVWIKQYPNGEDIELDVSGGTKTETYLEGLESGQLQAPPIADREHYRQVDVAEVVMSSESDGEGGNHVVTFLDADGRILFKMGIGGTTDVAALGELGKRLEPTPNAGYIPASSFSIALTAGYDLGGITGDIHRMRRSPVKLTVNESYLSTTNGGVFNTANSPSSGQEYLDSIKGSHAKRDAKQDTLAFFTNGEATARTITPKTWTAKWDEKAYGKVYTVHEQTWQEDHLGNEFDLNQLNGPMAMGLYGNLKMGQFNSVVEEGPRPDNIDHLDTEWTSLVDLGGGYGAFIGANGGHHVRNATYVDIQGDEGDQNFIHLSQSLAWDAQREIVSGDVYSNTAGQGKPQIVTHRDNPAVYVHVDTPNGKTVIDNAGETGVADADKSQDGFFNKKGEATVAEFDPYDAMTATGPEATVNNPHYADDKFELNTGDYEFTDVEGYDLPQGAKQNSSGFNADEMMTAYIEAEKAFDGLIHKDPAVIGEGELLEGEAMWEIYGPNYAAEQENLTNFFAQYRDQFGSTVPLDDSLDPDTNLDAKDSELEKALAE